MCFDEINLNTAPNWRVDKTSPPKYILPFLFEKFGWIFKVKSEVIIKQIITYRTRFYSYGAEKLILIIENTASKMQVAQCLSRLQIVRVRAQTPSTRPLLAFRVSPHSIASNKRVGQLGLTGRVLHHSHNWWLLSASRLQIYGTQRIVQICSWFKCKLQLYL